MLIQMIFASVSAIGQSGKCYIIELHVQCMQIKEELITTHINRAKNKILQ